ncbi:DUF6514 family protein [Bittarella massiliensis (ex Durand et al. 2017)]|uniref:DUF6514 family protein n=1 Tax=Bittarella massiliensis (ex Durand et al. 2017) TaxID=1720313 RepID=UPI001AA1545B|nr:DUF6514 family protein [Bittarella massiliensis (ex Durand et al. 2017)]MBO1678251.1 hypothetical protein [Bittarella massiliensis (ex Durand et al. 2017)]
MIVKTAYTENFEEKIRYDLIGEYRELDEVYYIGYGFEVTAYRSGESRRIADFTSLPRQAEKVFQLLVDCKVAPLQLQYVLEDLL